MTPFKKILSILSAVAFLAMAAISCNSLRGLQTPDTEYAEFIDAYTGGVITDGSTVKVALASAVPAGTSTEDLFSFSPSVKGAARWISDNTVEFVPDNGALKPGKGYKCTFNLGKVLKIKDRKLKKFSFGFMVAAKQAAFGINNIIIGKDTPGQVSVEGTLTLSEPLDKEEARELIDIPEGQLTKMEASLDRMSYSIVIEGISREESDRQYSISMKPGPEGFSAKSSGHITIPGTKTPFGVLSASLSEGKTPLVKVMFSEPLADMADWAGIMSLEGVNRYYIETRDNIADIYFEGEKEAGIDLKISEVVKSIDGQKLTSPFTTHLASSEEKPSVTIPLKGSILPDASRLVLPFRAVNLNAVDIRVIKIYEKNVLMFLQTNDENGDEQLRRAGRLVYRQCIRLDTDPSKDLHKWNDYSVDLSGLFRQEPGAIYRIRLSFKQEYSLYGKDFSYANNMQSISESGITQEDEAVWDTPYAFYYDSNMDWNKYEWKDRDNPMTPTYYMVYEYPEVNLMTSDIGLIAKYADGDKLWITASDIMTAKPMYGAEIEVFDYQLNLIGRGRTDSYGFEEIQLKGKPFAVVAKKGNATSYLKVTDVSQNSMSRFDVGGTRLEKGLKAYIYGERGVWRPGDTLHVTMILHDKENRIPDTHPAVMELYTPEGQFHSKSVCGKALNGFYTYSIPTLPDDPTGIWNAYLKVGGATFHKALRVESIKPNRLKVNMDMGGKILQAGVRTPVSVSASWLTGPAASGLQTRAYMTLSRGGNTFKGFDGYVFTDPASSFTSSEHDLIDTRLDYQGKAGMTINMPAASGAPGMLVANIVCSVIEQGGDASFTTMTMPYSPYKAYVGIKIPKSADGWLETGKDHEIEIATVDSEGRRVAGENLEYRIFKMDWSWWWESRAEDLDSYVNGSSANVYTSGRLVSGNSSSKIVLNVGDEGWGRYLIYVKDLDSGHAAGVVTMVDWPSYRGRGDRKDPDALTMLTFSTDKKSYSAGEQAIVFIPAAKDGRALVSLENSTRVISRKWVNASDKEDTPYKFQVTPEMAPNFYIHITLLQPHGNTANDLPIRMYGVQPVSVEDKGSRLEPVISMPDAIHPEEKFTIKVSEKSGKPMTYTIAIVDEGLLDLTGFKTPDPWNDLYAREALMVKTWDLYDNVIGAYSGRFAPMFSVGGDQAIIINNKKDNRFNPVVMFMGPFSLSKGSGTHTVELPMYVGSVRVMVVAGQDGAYGNAAKTVPVRSPLMILPTLPRVISSGEDVVLPVNVFALEESVKSAEISVSTEGPVKVSGDRTSSVTFSKPGDKLVRFSLKTDGEGPARVTVTAKGGGRTASETISINVRNANPPVVGIQKAMLKEGESKSFTYSPLKATEGSYAKLEITGFPSINFDSNFQYFTDYRYSCTEQLAAKGISLVYTLGLMSEENADKARGQIPEILQELYSRQLADGGFAYWPGQTAADTWATSMAGQFLTEAAEKGFNVSQAVRNSWLRFQNNSVRNYRKAAGKLLIDLDQAYRLYTLALDGKADNASMNRLKEGGELSSQARWMLASAYSICGKKNIADDLISGTGEEFGDDSPSNITFGSALRDRAIATETFVLTDKIPEAVEQAEKIADAFSDGYASTQERAFASIALSRLAGKLTDGSLSAEVTQSRTENLSGKGGMTCNLDPEDGKVQVRNTSSGAVYVSVVTVGKAPVGQAVPARSNGLKMKVSYIAGDGTALNPASIRQGTDFTAIITVTNPSLGEDYTGMALTQMIPSGWEIYNDRLAGTVVTSQNSFNYNDIRDDRNIWYFDLPRGTSKTFKTRLRAAYEGKFVLPAVTCEAMYNARTSASSASGTAEVVR